jgi:DNA-binding YbaB/EbfC family protein
LRTLKKREKTERKFEDMKANYRSQMGPSNMQSMIKQAQKMQEDMAQVQADLEAKEYEIKAGGGAVTVKINGKKEIISLDIAPEIVDPDDIETLADVITAGVNEAIKTVEDDAAAEMGKVTGGMGGMMGGIPGLF